MPTLFQQPKDRAVVPFVAGMPVELNLLAERRMVEIGGTLCQSGKDLGAVMRVEKALAQLLALMEAERLLATEPALPAQSHVQGGKEFIGGAQFPGEMPNNAAETMAANCPDGMLLDPLSIRAFSC